MIVGIVMKIWPPKKMNMLYGYRTTLSTSSEEAWNLAQKHSPKAMLRYGVIMIVIGIFTGRYIITDPNTPIMFIVELFVLVPLFSVLMILSTHRYLKRKLNKE